MFASTWQLWTSVCRFTRIKGKQLPLMVQGNRCHLIYLSGLPCYSPYVYHDSPFPCVTDQPTVKICLFFWNHASCAKCFFQMPLDTIIKITATCSQEDQGRMERQDRYRPTVQKLGHFRVPCVDTHNALTTPICTCCYKGFYTFLCGEDGREIFGTYLVS